MFDEELSLIRYLRNAYETNTTISLSHKSYVLLALDDLYTRIFDEGIRRQHGNWTYDPLEIVVSFIDNMEMSLDVSTSFTSDIFLCAIQVAKELGALLTYPK